ncbi:MAG: Clp protease N-terminal domain-containing protein [Candidatus Binataceae bacterium]
MNVNQYTEKLQAALGRAQSAALSAHHQAVDVEHLLGALLEERKIEQILTERAREYLAERGYDPSFGARPLRRLIQRELETALGRKLLAGEVRDNSRVTVDAGARGLEFKSSTLAKAA